MIKIKIEFELDEENIQDIFESRDIKFTKKKLAELKRNLKGMDDTDYDFAYELQNELDDDFREFLGNFISELFDEQ